MPGAAATPVKEPRDHHPRARPQPPTPRNIDSESRANRADLATALEGAGFVLVGTHTYKASVTSYNQYGQSVVVTQTTPTRTGT